MTLILDLPQDVDEQLQRKADRQGVAKEALAVDILARTLDGDAEPTEESAIGTAAPDFWSSNIADSLIRPPGYKPVTDFDEWLRSLPTVEGVDELVRHIEDSRRERRELEHERSQ